MICSSRSQAWQRRSGYDSGKMHAGSPLTAGETFVFRMRSDPIPDVRSVVTNDVNCPVLHSYGNGKAARSLIAGLAVFQFMVPQRRMLGIVVEETTGGSHQILNLPGQFCVLVAIFPRGPIALPKRNRQSGHCGDLPGPCPGEVGAVCSLSDRLLSHPAPR